MPTYISIRREDQRSSVQVQGHRLPLHSATIWPLHSTQGFHQGNKGGPGSPPPKRGNWFRLPRRLVSTRQLPTRGSRQYKRHRLPPDETGVVNQCREIQPRAHSIDHILRGPSRPRQRHGLPDGRKNGKPSGHGQKNTRQSEYPSAHVAAPLGKMASFTDLLDLCRLRMRPLQRHRIVVAATPIPLPTGLRPFLTWWAESDRIAAGRPFRNPAPTTSITTDASLSGWGAVWGTHTVAGEWAEPERGLHINILETEAVLRAVRHWATHLTGHTVTVRSDNTTTVAYINRQGGTRSLASYAGHGTCSSSATPFGSAYGRPT
ncbi:putative TBC1 domain family member 2A [Apostichopus japonicus]|uniref:Putative TBC1 domain family member 2A n=1 Tax=Stichopus japonicus TaxID=307972 RepID=A0A2G8K2F0_STIJA|nr:putative TBC1 domain family member 2A [Apostichopus japonicus]